MRIVVITHSVKAADADTPAAILVPAEGLDIAGFHCDDRGTDGDEILKWKKEERPAGWLGEYAIDFGIFYNSNFTYNSI